MDKAQALHLANRLGFGPAPGGVERIASTGMDAFVESQLHPRSGFPQDVVAVLQSLPSFGKSSADVYSDYFWQAQVDDPKSLPKEEKKRLKKRENQVAREARIARLARAVGSPWQLQEALAEFWFNHFNVYDRKGPIKVWIGAYEEEAIRPNTLGRFSDLLLATAKHPAMLVYLDNARNMAPAAGARANAMQSQSGEMPKKNNKQGINENYAREVMELHTLGVDGGYTQSDVVSLAHILTGWTVGAGALSDAEAAAEKFSKNRGAFHFAPRKHDPSQEVLLGRSFSGDDVGEGEAALLMLAAHPATAHHISLQLAQFFVADQPDPLLVDAMTKTFRDSGGDIRGVLKTMIAHPAFLSPANISNKYKTPYRYVVSAARAVGMKPGSVEPLQAALADLGQPLYGCISPDGYACTQSAWLDPDGLLRRLAFAGRLGDGEFGASGNSDEGGAPDPDRLAATLAPGLGRTTLAALSGMAREQRAGAILGSPDFMRC